MIRAVASIRRTRKSPMVKVPQMACPVSPRCTVGATQRYGPTPAGGRSFMIVRSLESVSGSRLLCPAVVIK